MVEGNGHHWPGSTELLPTSIVGPCLDPFKATDRVWDFFPETSPRLAGATLSGRAPWRGSPRRSARIGARGFRQLFGMTQFARQPLGGEREDLLVFLGFDRQIRPGDQAFFLAEFVARFAKKPSRLGEASARALPVALLVP